MVHPLFLHPLASEATVPDSYDGMTIFCGGEDSIVSVIRKALEPQRVFGSIHIGSAMRHNRHIVIDPSGRECEYQFPPCACPVRFYADSQLL